ncbi:MAG: arginin-tRNA ligase [Pseudomonadota bacterium]
MKKLVSSTLASALGFNIDVERPKDDSFGHFALPCFTLAKKERKSPQIIASEIAQKLKDCSFISEAVVVGGYVNIRLSSEFLASLTTEALIKDIDFAKAKNLQKQNILLEFVSANPTGPLHIGHARGAIYGDTLLKVGKYIGHDIASEYYINDAGRQVWLLGLSIFLRGRELLGKSVELPEEYYRGEYIVELAEEAKTEFGADIFEDETNIEKLSTWGKDKMLIEIKSNLADFDISFENFISEKEIYKTWSDAKEELDKHNALYMQDGKVWLKTTQKTDEKDRVVIRDDGQPTYLAGDIAYHKNKFERNYEKYINIWGADHHGYIARVKASIDFLGYDSSKLEVLLSQMVALLKGGEPYKMSKRAGNFILMKDVAADIGTEALKFAFLSKKSDTHLEFDVDELKQEDSSNPIFYIQYAHARIHSLFEKAGKNISDAASFKTLELNDDEKLLLLNALYLPSVLEDAFNSRDMQRITDYLKQLATKFHKFYTDHKVVGDEREETYLKIFALTALSIRTALSLLGIKAKNRM